MSLTRGTIHIINKKLNLLKRKVVCASGLGHSLINDLNEDEANLFTVAYLFLNEEIMAKITNIPNHGLKTIMEYCIAEEINYISDINSSKCIIDPLGNPISDISNIKIDVSDVNDELLKLLKNNPDYLYKLSPRKFEEVVAEILYRKGYDVTLTPATRDGGKDIFVAKKDDLGSFLYLVECKKYAPNRPVGIDVIQRLYGVVSDERATAGIIATTSYFTKSVKDFQQKHSFQMSLKDYDSIKKWLYDIT